MDKIVLCVGDSLGMPRKGVPFCETWYYKIIKHKTNYCFVNDFRRALTTNDLNSEDFLENYSPSVVILQVGIVDCAPRYFKNNSLFIKVINRTPSFVRSLFWKSVKRLRERTPSNCDVSPDAFKNNLIEYLKRCEEGGIEKIIIVEIPTPGKTMIAKNPKILDSILVYNRIFHELQFRGDFFVIDPLIVSDENDYTEDGYHLSKQGFDKVFNRLISLI